MRAVPSFEAVTIRSPEREKDAIPSRAADSVWGTADDVGDLHLHSPSLCIDSGDTCLLFPATVTDLGGRARFLDDLAVPNTGCWDGTLPPIDMGAYEAPGYFFRRPPRRPPTSAGTRVPLVWMNDGGKQARRRTPE